MISRFAAIVSQHRYEILVSEIPSAFKMVDLTGLNQRFLNFPEAYYAVDVTFKQSFRPSGAIEEGKSYFSGKHKLFGAKAEVSVLLNGLALACSNHFPRNVSDFEIFRQRIELHKSFLKNKNEDDNIPDSGMSENE